MENTPSITIEVMQSEAELFRSVYTDLISEIERGELTRGKLNDFQLIQAVNHAKSGLGVLNYERRQTINAIFEVFSAIYRAEGRTAAELWASQTFGCTLVEVNQEDTADLRARIEELMLLIQVKESELLHIYRELHYMQQCLITGQD